MAPRYALLDCEDAEKWRGHEKVRAKSRCAACLLLSRPNITPCVTRCADVVSFSTSALHRYGLRLQALVRSGNTSGYV